jgi:hypothetical protein
MPGSNVIEVAVSTELLAALPLIAAERGYHNMDEFLSLVLEGIEAEGLWDQALEAVAGER